MKVYFEATCSTWRDGKEVDVYVHAYVNPTEEDDGYKGYQFNEDGNKYVFYWAEPDEAKVYDSKDLPKDLLYSFRHGVCDFKVPDDKGDNWTPEDLIYTKVDRKRLATLRKVKKALPDVKTLDEFWKLYPLIKQCGYVSIEMVDTLFGLIQLPRTPMYNGELGMAWAQDVANFQFLCNRFNGKSVEEIQKFIQQAKAKKQ